MIGHQATQHGSGPTHFKMYEVGTEVLEPLQRSVTKTLDGTDTMVSSKKRFEFCGKIFILLQIKSMVQHRTSKVFQRETEKLEENVAQLERKNDWRRKLKKKQKQDHN